MKKILITIFIIAGIFTSYVAIATCNQKNMTVKQRILKAVYPVTMLFKGSKDSSVLHNKNNTQPAVSFHNLQDTMIDGSVLDFSTLKGKKVLLVNTASACGYTPQYEGLQKLSEQYKDKLIIIGFPANDFKEQEKGSNEDIAAFCKKNYGVTFPLSAKSTVVSKVTADMKNVQNNVFKWLTQPGLNGWNSKEPTWNFSKYLVDENGVLTHWFAPSISPQGAEIAEALK